MLAGARSFTAVAEWAADAGDGVWSTLGIVRVPDASTFRRVFAPLDADALDIALGAWVSAATTPARGQRRRVAGDGKTLRGSCHGETSGRHLLAAVDQHHAIVLAQRTVDTPNPTSSPAHPRSVRSTKAQRLDPRPRSVGEPRTADH
ncbi:hypothetical protein FRAHR75_1000015 [Frankia sp. Hr75.2]|nr:hypothetical protein FRAHR75_1000015 [Frankia sp. Hr75.2]